jgi:hypothetical protein
MEKTSAVVNTGDASLVGDELGRIGLVLVFMVIAALIVVRRLVLPRR